MARRIWCQSREEAISGIKKKYSPLHLKAHLGSFEIDRTESLVYKPVSAEAYKDLRHSGTANALQIMSK